MVFSHRVAPFWVIANLPQHPLPQAKVIRMSEDLNDVLGVVSSSAPSPGTPSNPVVRRYRDAYRVAAIIIACGTIIKVLGWIIGGLILVTGLVAGSGVRGGAGGIIGITIVIGIIQMAVFFVLGVLIASLGQVLRATLDAAVYSSPFLDKKQKGEAIGL